tara:strand:- start:2704 stop:3333 length:630 start_codon:yes stop_codon:yes gene_type:complete
MAKQQSRLVGALAKVPTGKLPGRVYAGGTPYFDERTGKRTVPPQSPQMGPPLTQAPQMQRVSPGVYRNPQGQLIQQQQPQRPPMPSQRPGMQPMQQPQEAYTGMGSAFGNKPYMFPQPQQPFNNQFQSGFGTGIGAAFGGQPEQMPQQQYNQQQPQQMQQQAFAQQLGQGFGQPQQGIVADRQPLVQNGQMSPIELQAIQNGTFKGYNY